MFSIFKMFDTEESNIEVKKYGKLFEKFKGLYPNLTEDKIVIASCISGLMARVAYVDFELAPEEVQKMKNLISKWEFSPEIDSNVVTDIAIAHIKEMAGLENHLYVKPLNKFLNKEDRFKVLESLFLIAASDGEVEAVESEEIRVICKGLELSSQHFLSARAEVSDFLKALK